MTIPAKLLTICVCLSFSLFAFVMACSGRNAPSAKGARASGNGFAEGASLQPLPDGNHGENVLQGASL